MTQHPAVAASLAVWHDCVARGDFSRLPELLHADAVFRSPMAHAPYQLRLTVSGCTAENTPEDGDAYAYPAASWTYLHVLTGGFKIKPGRKTLARLRTGKRLHVSVAITFRAAAGGKTVTKTESLTVRGHKK